MLRAPHLARYLALAYGLLIVYASLHPFMGWRDNGVPVIEFLFARWPRYYTTFDLVINVLAYVPLGFLLIPALRDPLGGWISALLAVVGGACLSFGMELLQNFLPSRVPSNLDLACNSLGALLGSLLGLRWGDTLRDGGALHNLRDELVVGGKQADAGLILLGLWLLAQLNPATMLFGYGDLRTLFEFPAPLPYTREGIQVVELGVTAANVVAVGLIGWRMLRRPRPFLLVLVFALALLIRALAAGVLIGPDYYLQWITAGSLAGLAMGGVLLFVGLVSPPLVQHTSVALALFIGTALVNLAPENPYLLDTLQGLNAGHFLNFNGLTRLASSLWPFVAIGYLMALGPPRKRKRRNDRSSLTGP